MTCKIKITHQYRTQDEAERKKQFNLLLAKYINSQASKT